MGRTAPVRTSSHRMVMQPTADMQVGGSIPGWTAIAAAVGRPGFEPPTCTPAVGCFTTRPLLVLGQLSSPLLEPESATEKNPNCACLLARLTV